MRKKVNNCVNCGLPCMMFCPLRDDSYAYYCDKCGYEVQADDLYIDECTGDELCLDCIHDNLKRAYY